MLLALGSNGAGQLGLSHTDDVSVPQEVKLTSTDQSSKIKRIVAGGNHTVILLDDGFALAAGNNEDGRCGIANLSETAVFESVSFPTAKTPSLVDVAATWSASYFVAHDRRTIYVCGTGQHGELGLGPDIASTNIPGCIVLPNTIASLEACLSHTVATLTNGELWGWGKGRKGQLGIPAQDCWRPRRVDVPFMVIKAVCGSDFTCILGKEGQVKVLGSDKRDRFALRSETPTSVNGLIDVAASWGSIMLRVQTGVIAWGRNDRGQLPPSTLPPIVEIAAGSEHWLALTLSGDVLAGGWSEHGNCGEPKDEQGVVKGRWNVLRQADAKHVFAGCATSFIGVERSLTTASIEHAVKLERQQ